MQGASSNMNTGRQDAVRQEMSGAEAVAGESSLQAGQLRRLVMLRWWSVALMLGAALAMPGLLGLSIALGPALSVALALAAFNLFSLAWLRVRGVVWPGALVLQLVVDLLGWSLFIYQTGGAANPLISMLLPLLAIAAAILPAASAWVLAGLAVCAYSLLWQFHVPIRLVDPAAGSYLHLAGMWATFSLSAVLMVVFVSRMTRALRARDRALAEAARARARDEQLLALGNMAAGTAHSLGTPLATMRLLIDEMLSAPQLDSSLREDVHILSEQVEHCRTTLGLLTARTGGRRAEGGRALSAADWLDKVLREWGQQRPQARVQARLAPELGAWRIVADETLGQALASLLDNAVRAGAGAAELMACLSDDQLVVEVCDRGPGIPPALLDTLGEQPLQEGAQGMGLGVYLARSAITRTGGVLRYAPREGGGTVARMELPLARISA